MPLKVCFFVFQRRLFGVNPLKGSPPQVWKYLVLGMIFKLRDGFVFFLHVFLRLLVSNKIRERSEQVQGTCRKCLHTIWYTLLYKLSCLFWAQTHMDSFFLFSQHCRASWIADLHGNLTEISSDMGSTLPEGLLQTVSEKTGNYKRTTAIRNLFETC